MKTDFHLHTWHSDGALAPGALLAAVRQAQVEWFAVTDHDTLAGWSALRGTPGLLPGVEVTAGRNGREIHVVGLGIAPDEGGLAAFLAGIRATRLERLAVLIARLPVDVARGVTVADLRDRRAGPEGALGRLHLARELVRRGGVPSVQEAFVHHLGDEYAVDAALPPYPAVADACAAIRAAGGVAILAHPGMYTTIGAVVELMALGCDGLETSHPNLDPTLASQLAAAAEERGWLASSGADLHYLGARKPGNWCQDTPAALRLRARLGLAA